MTGRAEIPAFVLTAAETLLIRSDAVPGPLSVRQGAPRLGQGLGTADGQARLAAATARLSPAGQQQIVVALQVTAVVEERLAALHRPLPATRPARELQARLYGVGPVTALALACWLGGQHRFYPPEAVRFAGLDVTVYFSAGKHSPVSVHGSRLLSSSWQPRERCQVNR